MSTIIGPITAEDLLAMPDDGIDRELVRGELRECPMTKCSRMHCNLTSRISHLLLAWLEQHPTIKGGVFDGEVAVRLSRDPDTAVGIDVAFVSEEILTKTPPEHFFVEGAPILAVEVLSPSDTTAEVADKVDLYLECGVAVVWVVNPRFRMISVHRPRVSPISLDMSGELSGDPELSGFRASLKEIFKSDLNR